MTSDRFARLRKVVLAAVAIPAEERDAWLERTCDGDDSLLREARSLLAGRSTAAAAIDGLLDRAGASSLAEVPRPERIGPYRILDVLGEGGMGIVYRAEQRKPIRRDVALKLVRYGLDSAAVRARLEGERQTQARLEHPNIARVLDAGADEAGRPYFVMELVQGRRITEYCRRNNMGIRERVRLFLDVAQGMGHAHHRGVIHRDLKPSNLLVTEVEGRAVPKIIDFGIAKALEDPVLATAFRTRTGQVVGTLEYMSPEQAYGDPSAIDTRSDVWSLGVILYELLADRLPFDLSGAPFHDAVQRLVESPPISLRRTASGTTRIESDLDTIVGKCLEKDPDRRYGSAAELAEDLQRYLDSLPIRARPPSRMYQIRMLVRRHRLAFAFASTVFLLLVGSAITVSVQLGIQKRERAHAEAEARAARRVTRFLQDMLSSVSPELRGREVTVKEVLDEAAAGIEQAFAEDPEVDAAIRHTIGGTYRALEDHDRAEPFLVEALRKRTTLLGADHRDTGATHYELARLYRQDERLGEGLVEIDAALRIERGLAEPDPHALALYARERGAILVQLDRLDEAEHEFTTALDLFDSKVPPGLQAEKDRLATLNTLGFLYYVESRPTDSERVMQEVLTESRRIFGDRHVSVADALHALGVLRTAECEALLKQALELWRELQGPRTPSAAKTLGRLGQCYASHGRFVEAEAAVREAIEIRRETIGERNMTVGISLSNLSFYLLRQHRAEEALAVSRDAISIIEESVGEDHRYMGFAMKQLGDTLHALGRDDEAETALRRSVAVFEHLSADHHWIGEHRYHLAVLLAARGKREEALDAVNRALDAMGTDHGYYRRAAELRARLLENSDSAQAD